MQQLQYNAPNLMYVFQNLSEGATPEPPFGTGTQNRAPPLQNPRCAPVYYYWSRLESCTFRLNLSKLLKDGGKNYYCQPIRSCIWPFNWHIDISFSLNVKINVMHNSTANTSKIVTYGANSAIAIKYEVTYGLSISIFRLEVGLV